MSKYLAIDYGTKRIGTAVSDEDKIFAFKHGIIENKNDDYVLKQLAEIIKENEIELIIVGLPLGLDEKPTQMSNTVQSFVEFIYNKSGVEVTTWNETLTSEFASQNLRSLPKHKRNIDSEAARIILQEYLDFRKEKIP